RPSRRTHMARPAIQSTSRAALHAGPSGSPAPRSATRLWRQVTSPHASQRRDGSSRASTLGPTAAIRGSAPSAWRAAAVAPGRTRASLLRTSTTSAPAASAARMPRLAPPAYPRFSGLWRLVARPAHASPTGGRVEGAQRMRRQRPEPVDAGRQRDEPGRRVAGPEPPRQGELPAARRGARAHERLDHALDVLAGLHGADAGDEPRPEAVEGTE